ncbi:MAG TPA: hypothetical protein VF006_22015 [Longimicrobium sp.]
MRAKLRLSPEDLSVDSFDTMQARQAKGTVLGEQCTCYTQCTCPGCPTCYDTCEGRQTCGASCADTCPQTCVYTCIDDTCAAWCGGTADTYCNCGATCGQTDCGPYFCCA